MNIQHKVNILIAILGLMGSILAAIIGVIWGKSNVTVLVQLDGRNVSLNGEEIQELALENEEFRNKISAYELKIETLENNSKNLSDELSNANGEINKLPLMEFRSLGFFINGEEQIINKNDSFVTIDGNEYFSKEFIDNLLPENTNLTIKDDAVYIGRVIADKTSLFNQKVMDQEYCGIQDSATDSYGNTYSNILFMSTQYTKNSDYIIYVLDGKYSLLRFSASIRDTAELGRKGILTIKADDQVVYTSGVLNKQTKFFTESDIPINNCTLLTIEYNSEGANGCIISDAIIYN